VSGVNIIAKERVYVVIFIVIQELYFASACTVGDSRSSVNGPERTKQQAGWWEPCPAQQNHCSLRTGGFKSFILQQLQSSSIPTSFTVQMPASYTICSSTACSNP